MKNLGKKILAVMEEVESVEKDGFNAFHKYKYTSDAAIVTAIRKALIKNGLVCIPNQKSCVQAGNITTLTVEYTTLDVESGESIVTAVVGCGQDSGDKGVFKAATGAEKYFLLKTFLVPTDDDPEKDSNGKAKEAPRAATASPAPVKTTVTSAKKTPITIESLFDVPQEFVSSKGTKYWKTMNAEGAPFFVFDAVIADFMKKRAGEMMSADVEYAEKGNRIVGFREINVASHA